MGVVGTIHALPRHGGWWLAALLVVAGALLGLRAFLLPFLAVVPWQLIGLVNCNGSDCPAHTIDAVAVGLLFVGLFGLLACVPVAAGVAGAGAGRYVVGRGTPPPLGAQPDE
jgi:hypothetical protein